MYDKVKEGRIGGMRHAIASGLAAVPMVLGTVCANAQTVAPFKGASRDQRQTYVLDRRVVDACSSENPYIMPRTEFEDCLNISILAGAPALLRHEKDEKAIEMGRKKYGDYQIEDRIFFSSFQKAHLPFTISQSKISAQRVNESVELSNRIISEDKKARREGEFEYYTWPNGTKSMLKGLAFGAILVLLWGAMITWQSNRR